MLPSVGAASKLKVEPKSAGLVSAVVIKVRVSELVLSLAPMDAAVVLVKVLLARLQVSRGRQEWTAWEEAA